MLFYKTELVLSLVEDDMFALILKCISLGEVQGVTGVVLPQHMT